MIDVASVYLLYDEQKRSRFWPDEHSGVASQLVEPHAAEVSE